MSALASPSKWMSEDTRLFRKEVRQFLQKEFAPHQERWRGRAHTAASPSAVRGKRVGGASG